LGDRFKDEVNIMLHEIELGDSALDYIKEELANGDLVAKFLLQQIKFEQGVIRTHLPDDVNDKATLDFRDSVAKDYQAMYTETHKWVAGFITAYLSQQKNNIAVFETLGSPKDPFLQRRKPQYFSNQQNVYVYTAGNSYDEQEISQILREARGYPCVGILTSLSNIKTISSEQTVSDDFIQKLVKETKHIIIGAFDEDGFLLWSKLRE
jgi:hypothetical protein